MGIRKFKDRKPSLPFKWVGVELQFYERFEEADETVKVINENGEEEDKIVLFAYKEYKLPWRVEFDQKAAYDEEGNLVQDSYINANYEALLAEAKTEQI